MKKRKLLILFVLCCSLLSCEVIENNSRIAFELKVTDDSNQPIPDINTNVSIFRKTNFIPFVLYIQGFKGVSGVGSTNSQGNSTLISLTPDESIDEIGVLVNSDQQFAGTPSNEDYGVVIYQLESIEDKSRIIALPDKVLKRTATLEIEIIDSPSQEGDLAYTITYPTRIQRFQFPEGESETTETIQGTGVPSSSGVLRFNTLQNTIALFNYTITSDIGVVESDTIEIPINQETVAYEFEF